MVEVPTTRLLASILLSFAIPALALMIAVGVIVVVTGEIRSLVSVILVAVVIGASAWATFSRQFEFRVAAAADGVRIRRGLLEQRTQTVPPGRVQAVRLSQPLLWRPMRWWRVEVNIVGYGVRTGEQGRQDTTLLPVGTSADACAVLSFVIAQVVIDDHALVGTGGNDGFVAAPSAARWVDPIAWRRHGFRVDPSVLVLRGGRLHRRLDVVPHARTQSSAVRRGPVQRRLGLATFALHSTPGPIQPRVEHLREAVVIELLENQTVRARAERVIATDEWLAPGAPDAVDTAGAGGVVTGTRDATPN